MSLCLLGSQVSIRLFGLVVFTKFELETDETDRLSRLPDGNIKEGRSLFSDANHERGRKISIIDVQYIF